MARSNFSGTMLGPPLYVGIVQPREQSIHPRQRFVRHHADRTQRMRLGDEASSLRVENRLSVNVPAPRITFMAQSGGSSINASRTLRDDVFQRHFSNLLES